MAIDEDLRKGEPVLVPSHFEADAYAGLRRMFFRRQITRENVDEATARLGRMDAERVALAPLLPAALALFDRASAHDVFYMVLARSRGVTLVTSDRPMAEAAQMIGVSVRLHARGPIS